MKKLNLKELAKKEITFSELIVDKTAIDNDDIIKYFPEGITIYAADPVSVNDSRYYVYLFREDNDKFGASGLVLTKIFDRIMAECQGDVAEFNAQLEGGLKIKLVKGKTGNKDENGNYKTIYNVEVVD